MRWTAAGDVVVKMLSNKSPYERERAATMARLKVTERLKYPRCESCGSEVTFWLPTEAPEPDDFGRAMTWAQKCGCGALLTMLLEERKPGAAVHMLGEWTPFVHEHLSHEPVRIESRQQFRRELKARGLRTDHEGG